MSRAEQDPAARGAVAAAFGPELAAVLADLTLLAIIGSQTPTLT